MSRKRFPFLLHLWLVACGLMVPASVYGQTPRFAAQEITATGVTNVNVSAINRHGQVTGTAVFPGQASYHAFLWSDGQMVDLGTLGGAFSYPTAINDSGDVLGTSQLSSGEYAAFLYRGGRTYALNPGGGASHPLRINNAGQAVIYDNRALRAFAYAPVQGGLAMQVLSPPGATSSTANDLTESGLILGQASYPSGPRPFVFEIATGTLNDATALGPHMVGQDINEHGVVVGRVLLPDGRWQMFVYSAGAAAANPTVTDPSELKINDRGEITGNYVPPGSAATRAFLLDASGFRLLQPSGYHSNTERFSEKGVVAGRWAYAAQTSTYACGCTFWGCSTCISTSYSYRAFVYRAGTLLSFGSGHGYVADVSRTGHAVGRADASMFVLDAGGGLYYPSLPDTPSINPSDVNEAGDAVGTGFGPTPSLPTEGIFVRGRETYLLKDLVVTPMRVVNADRLGEGGHVVVRGATAGRPEGFYLLSPWTDTMPPAVAATVMPLSPTGWHNQDVTVRIHAVDPLPGDGTVSEIDYTLTDAKGSKRVTVAGAATDVLIETAGETLVTYSARDGAGNWSNEQALTVRIDRTHPLIGFTLEGTKHPSGWFTSDVRVRWSVSDPESPIFSTSGCAETVVTQDSPQLTFDCLATSGGGAGGHVIGLRRDTTAPAVTVTSPAAGAVYQLYEPLTADYACTDIDTEATCTGTVADGAVVDTSVPGQHTFEVRAVDSSGHSTTKQVHYVVAHDQVITDTDLWVTVDDTVKVLDARTFATRAAFGSFGRPFGIAFDPNGNRAWVADAGRNQVLVFAARPPYAEMGNITVGRHPFDITASRDGRFVYTANLEDGTVSVISTSSMTVSRTISVGALPRSVLALDDGRLLVSLAGDGRIAVVNPGTSPEIAWITVGHNPQGIALDPRGAGRAFVAIQQRGTVVEIDLAALAVVREFAAVGNAHEVALAPDYSMLYVTGAEPGGPIARIDVASTERAVMTVGAYPSRVSTAPTLPRAYVAGAGTGELFVVDTVSAAVVGAHSLGTQVLGASIAPVPAQVSVSATGIYGGTATAQVTLTERGRPIVSRHVEVSLDGASAAATTDSLGRASVALPVTGRAAGDHAGAVYARFAGDLYLRSADAVGDLKVAKAVPAVTWDIPVSLAYGTALGPDVLSASSKLAGTMTYEPAAGTVLDAGMHQLLVRFRPTDPNYGEATATRTLIVDPVVPAVTWQPQPTTYGAPLGPSQLNASSAVAGSFAYTPAAGTLLPPGQHQLSAVFTPSSGNYLAVTSTATLTVGKAIASLVVGGGSHVYTGEPQGVTALAFGIAGEPLGPVTVAYRAVETAQKKEAGVEPDPVEPQPKQTPAAWTISPPVNAGFYEVGVSYPGDANYEAATTVGKLVIARATPRVEIGDATLPYDGTPHPLLAAAVGVQGEDLGAVVITYQPGGVAPTDAGIYQVNAAFGGNTNYEPASGSATLTITPADPILSVAGGEYTYDGSTRAAIAQVKGVRGEPLGTVSIAYAPGPGAPVNAGSYTATATFAGSLNYRASSGSTTIVIHKAAPTVAVTGGTFGYDGQPHGATGIATGVQGEDLGAVTLDYSPGGATPSSAGVYTVTGTFAGNSNYLAGSGSASLTIKPGAPTLRVAGGTFVYDSLGHPASASVTGVNGEDLGALTFLYNGAAAVPQSAGRYEVKARFAGAANYEPAEAETVITITPAPLAVTARDATKSYGEPNPVFDVTFAGFVGSETSTALAGTLAFATAADAASGVGTYPVTPGGVSSGNYAVTFNPGTLTIVQAPGRVALASSANPAGYMQSIALRAEVGTESLSPAAAPTGNVEFLSGEILLGSSTVTNGAATINTILPPGSHAVTARYLGDSNVTAAAASITQTVNDRSGSSTTTLRARPGTAQVGELVTIDVDVSSATAPAEGLVDLLDGERLVTTLTLAGGRVTYQTSDLATGSHALSARYHGSATVPPSTSSPVVVTVLDGQRLDRTTIRLSPKRAAAGAPVEIEILVSGSGSAPAGNVRVAVNGGAFVTLPLAPSGAAQAGAVWQVTLTPGTHVVTAIYGGSTTHAGSTGEIQLQVRK